MEQLHIEHVRLLPERLRNIVPTSGRDTATHQHMTTFTIGLGVSGTLAYDKNYLTQTAPAPMWI